MDKLSANLVISTMQIIPHKINDSGIAELSADEIIIRNADDALDLLGNVYYQGFDAMILHQKNITPDFFDLQNKMAGEMLQKFSNYRMRLVIVGDFAHFDSRSLQDFIRESNQGKTVNFVTSLEQALKIWNK